MRRIFMPNSVCQPGPQQPDVRYRFFWRMPDRARGIIKRKDLPAWHAVERVPASGNRHWQGGISRRGYQVPLSREEPVVEKEVHVTGGVRVRKTEGVGN